MDKLIESFADRPTKEKILITLGVTVGLLIITGVLYFLTTPKTQKTSQNQEDASQVVPTSFSPEKSYNRQPTTTPWKIYQEKTYQISYPGEYKIIPGVLNGGGSALLIEGKSEPEGYNTLIQVTEAQANSVENISNVFKNLKYNKMQILIDNVDAMKLSGNIGNLRETVVVFENKGKTYEIIFSYESPLGNSIIENKFKRALSTFKFL